MKAGDESSPSFTREAPLPLLATLSGITIMVRVPSAWSSGCVAIVIQFGAGICLSQSEEKRGWRYFPVQWTNP